jgi:hypothetical protein
MKKFVMARTSLLLAVVATMLTACGGGDKVPSGLIRLSCDKPSAPHLLYPAANVLEPDKTILPDGNFSIIFENVTAGSAVVLKAQGQNDVVGSPFGAAPDPLPTPLAGTPLPGAPVMGSAVPGLQPHTIYFIYLSPKPACGNGTNPPFGAFTTQ